MEIADETATLYLAGTLSLNDEPLLERICGALPDSIATLRLDLHGVGCMDAGAMNAVRAVLRYWRAKRGGSFRLTFATEKLVATYSEGRYAEPAPSMTAMYL